MSPALRFWLLLDRCQYVFSDLPDGPWFGDESKWRRIVCRWKGHPHGEIFFSAMGDEPDHRCRTCGEDIG